MLTRMLLALAALAALAWLAASLFVALYQPAGLQSTTLVLARTDAGKPRWELAKPPRPAERDADAADVVPPVPSTSRGSSISDPDGPAEHRLEYFLARGALDTGRGTFPLALGLLFAGWEPIRGVRLEITHDPDWARLERRDDADWVMLASTELMADDPWQWAALEGDAPAGAVAWRYVITAEDGGESSTGQTMPRPGGHLDRLLEDLDAHGFLRWLAPAGDGEESVEEGRDAD